MTGFTGVFTGTQVQPSNQLYVSLALATANTLLTWPLETAGPPNVADLMDVNATLTNLTLQMPNALQGTQGLTAIINNLGINSFNLLDNTGNVILTSAPGTVWMVYLASNSTQAGVWRTFLYGANNQSVNVAALAGAGLQVINQALAQVMENTTLGTSYSSGPGDLANTFIWDGGSGTFTLPPTSTVYSGWFIKVVNAGTGVLTITPQGGNQIDNASTKQWAIGGTGFIFTDGANWWSLGYGISGTNNGFGYINIALPASGSYTISGAQLNQITYLLTGALTGTVTFIVPASVQQYWINNETTGNQILTVISAASGASVNVVQGSQAILYCDGTNILNAVGGGGGFFPILVNQGGTGATTAAGAVTNLGGSATGAAVFTSASATAALASLGGGSVGIGLFETTTVPQAWNTLIGSSVVTTGMYAPGSGALFLTNSGAIWASARSTGVSFNIGQTQAYEPSYGQNQLLNVSTSYANTFQATLTGVSGTITGTAYYVRSGPLVMILLPNLTGNSNSTSMTITGLPSLLRPATQTYWGSMMSGFISGAFQNSMQPIISPSGVIQYVNDGSATGFLNDGLNKGVLAHVFSYFLT